MISRTLVVREEALDELIGRKLVLFDRNGYDHVLLLAVVLRLRIHSGLGDLQLRYELTVGGGGPTGRARSRREWGWGLQRKGSRS